MIKRLDWNEDISKQRNYEYKHIPKVGGRGKPWIEKL